MANALNLRANRSNSRGIRLNQDLYKRKRNCKTNRDNLKILETENSLFKTTANIKKELSIGQFEFVDVTKSIVSNHNFVIETLRENGSRNYGNTESCDNQISSNSMLQIELTPELPSDFPNSNSREKNNLELVRTDVDKSYYCAHCEKEYKTKKSIIQHLELKECVRELSPNDDNETVVKTKIRGPKIVRQSDKRYQCRHCDKTYTQKNNLFRHMREDHVKLAKPTCCNVCGKEFYNDRKLHQHQRCHLVKSYECSVCSKRFSQIAHVQSHMLTHTGEKPYKCHICERSFSKSFNLKIHIIRHKGEKEYKCKTCKTEFFTHGELEKHIRIHTAERPYSCKTCGKRFKQNAHLKKHLLSHTGQKPYKCTMCSKNYVNSSHLKKHILSHTGEKSPKHLCPICGTNFSQPSVVRRHIEKVHKK